MASGGASSGTQVAGGKRKHTEISKMIEEHDELRTKMKDLFVVELVAFQRDLAFFEHQINCYAYARAVEGMMISNTDASRIISKEVQVKLEPVPAEAPFKLHQKVMLRNVLHIVTHVDNKNYNISLAVVKKNNQVVDDILEVFTWGDAKVMQDAKVMCKLPDKPDVSTMQTHDQSTGASGASGDAPEAATTSDGDAAAAASEQPASADPKDPKGKALVDHFDENQVVVNARHRRLYRVIKFIPESREMVYQAISIMDGGFLSGVFELDGDRVDREVRRATIEDLELDLKSGDLKSDYVKVTYDKNGLHGEGVVNDICEATDLFHIWDKETLTEVERRQVTAVFWNAKASPTSAKAPLPPAAVLPVNSEQNREEDWIDIHPIVPTNDEQMTEEDLYEKIKSVMPTLRGKQFSTCGDLRIAVLNAVKLPEEYIELWNKLWPKRKMEIFKLWSLVNVNTEKLARWTEHEYCNAQTAYRALNTIFGLQGKNAVEKVREHVQNQCLSDPDNVALWKGVLDKLDNLNPNKKSATTSHNESAELGQEPMGSQTNGIEDDHVPSSDDEIV